MTSQHSAAARHLRVVGDTGPGGPAPGRDRAEETPLVGYVVLLPEGTDPTELFTADGTRARLRPLLPSEESAGRQTGAAAPQPQRELGAGGPPAPVPRQGLPRQAAPPAPEPSAQAQSGAGGDSQPAGCGPGSEAGDAEGLHVDTERHTAQADGRELHLTYLEFELLAHLVANPHRVHTRSHLVSTLWGYSHVGDGRTVDVHIARLRRKLGRFRDTIVTVRRVGYKYEPGRAR